MAFLRGIIYLVGWIAVSVLAGALLYPIILMQGGPFTECLSDPYAFTPGASSFNCRSDPMGIREMFDTAYRAGWMTIQTGSMIMAGVLGLLVGMFLMISIYAVVKKVKDLRK